jgi:hypothetical protein
MITLPDGHNHTTRRFSRTLSDAFADERASCFESSRELPSLRWALLGPIAFCVAGLALLLQVKDRAEERRAIVAACEAVQAADDVSRAPCRSLFVLSKGGR